MTSVEFEDKIQKFLKIFGRANPWLVGSAARYRSGLPYSSLEFLKDIDVIIPKVSAGASLDLIISKLPAPNLRLTGWGDYKIDFEGCEWDLIRKDVAEFLRRCPTALDGVAVHLKTGCVLRTDECATAALTAKNFEIKSRPTSKPDFIPYYEAHLRKQGL